MSFKTNAEIEKEVIKNQSILADRKEIIEMIKKMDVGFFNGNTKWIDRDELLAKIQGEKA